MILIYDDTALPTGPFPVVLNDNEHALQIAVPEGDELNEWGSVDDASYTITFEDREVFQDWARRVAELAGLKVTR